jgi:hypothetical protein
MLIDPDDEELIATQTDAMQQLRKASNVIQHKHDVIINRETRARLAASRQRYFDGASGRQLRGEVRLMYDCH